MCHVCSGAVIAVGLYQVRLGCDFKAQDQS